MIHLHLSNLHFLQQAFMNLLPLFSLELLIFLPALNHQFESQSISKRVVGTKQRKFGSRSSSTIVEGKPILIHP
jgi:hypothetical protein